VTLIGFPARNEAATIAGLVTRALALDLPAPVSVLVVDDASTDDTAARARSAGATVVGVDDGRSGLGAAVRTILSHADACGARLVAFLDADGEYAPEDIPALATPVLAGQADYVTGDRFARGRPPGMPLWRRVGNRAGSMVVSMLAGVKVRDAQSGLRVLSRRACKVAIAASWHDYNYAQVLTIGLARARITPLEMPVSYRRRQHGRTFVRLPVYLRRVLPAMARARWGRM
jgi:glycosyltransferase involved in cell wall biosynthesis